MYYNIRRILMEHSGNIPIFNIPGTLFWEYSPEFQRELFPNIPGKYFGNVPRTFHEHIFARWVGSRSPSEENEKNSNKVAFTLP